MDVLKISLLVTYAMPCLQEGESHALYTLGSVYHALGKKAVKQSGQEGGREALGKAVRFYE